MREGAYFQTRADGIAIRITIKKMIG